MLRLTVRIFGALSHQALQLKFDSFIQSVNFGFFIFHRIVKTLQIVSFFQSKLDFDLSCGKNLTAVTEHEEKKTYSIWYIYIYKDKRTFIIIFILSIWKLSLVVLFTFFLSCFVNTCMIQLIVSSIIYLFCFCFRS